VKFSFSFIAVSAIVSLMSVPALADRFVTDGGGMDDGSAGSWFDPENGFFGFSSPNLGQTLATGGGPFWGAMLQFTDGANTSSTINLTNVEILFSQGQFSSNSNSPLKSGTPDESDANAFSQCNVTNSPSFGANTATTILCQFMNTSFVPTFESSTYNTNNTTAWYALLDLGGTGTLGHVTTGSIGLTFLSSAPVPEPASIGLCLLGVGTIIAVHRRNRQKKGQA
jgi:hypothetical protein